MLKMSRCVNVKVNISEGQKAKIEQAMEAVQAVSIRLSHSDFNGEHMLALAHAQVDKMTKAYQNSTGITIKISKTQLDNNKTVVGGFIGAILPFLATAGKFLLSSSIPSLATGSLSGVGSAAGSKVVNNISGSGKIYLKKKRTGL